LKKTGRFNVALNEVQVWPGVKGLFTRFPEKEQEAQEWFEKISPERVKNLMNPNPREIKKGRQQE